MNFFEFYSRSVHHSTVNRSTRLTTTIYVQARATSGVVFCDLDIGWIFPVAAAYSSLTSAPALLIPDLGLVHSSPRSGRAAALRPRALAPTAPGGGQRGRAPAC
ncbi:hypothetical protein PVAP13_6KG184700 [Panicum virgatum]|uniref:Uncharacterized protein n=1 Tax=Panicum virgatum TaxID=38727 RepID=A0A8T0RAV4_PANVG|nr:hypothetical protein PVAP13_6KG184700 [Panicum virgatum]